MAAGEEPHRNQRGRPFRVDVSLPGSIFDASRTTKNALISGRRIGDAHTRGKASRAQHLIDWR